MPADAIHVRTRCGREILASAGRHCCAPRHRQRGRRLLLDLLDLLDLHLLHGKHLLLDLHLLRLQLVLHHLRRRGLQRPRLPLPLRVPGRRRVRRRRRAPLPLSLHWRVPIRYMSSPSRGRAVARLARLLHRLHRLRTPQRSPKRPRLPRLPSLRTERGCGRGHLPPRLLLQHQAGAARRRRLRICHRGGRLVGVAVGVAQRGGVQRHVHGALRGCVSVGRRGRLRAVGGGAATASTPHRGAGRNCRGRSSRCARLAGRCRGRVQDSS